MTGGGWYEIQQFVDNVTCKNFNTVMSVKTTTNKRGYLHRIGCVCICNTNSIVELHLFGYGNIVW